LMFAKRATSVGEVEVWIVMGMVVGGIGYLWSEGRGVVEGTGVDVPVVKGVEGCVDDRVSGTMFASIVRMLLMLKKTAC
jgi:hypothetical protein